MKFPINWVLKYVSVDWDHEELAERLTMSGSEVEHTRDGVMEVKVTPNRGDTLSMIGMARVPGMRVLRDRGRGGGDRKSGGKKQFHRGKPSGYGSAPVISKPVNAA